MDSATDEPISMKLHKSNNTDKIMTVYSSDFEQKGSCRPVSFDKFEKIFKANTAGPAIIGKYFLPLLNKNSTSKMCFLSAKVGSISDNRLGGWYSYRASKTALNQIIKNYLNYVRN